ncbi:MAG TPA: hypothetical protein VK934_01075 [Fimbriimonas sp.]|nr:hypothetical protein [Fimbriimonas sp.]
MIDFDFPSVEVDFTYDGEEAFTGDARLAFRCGMFLMLNYEGPEDAQRKFQDVFARLVRNEKATPEVLEAVATLLVVQLMHFDESFYDKAIERLFQLMDDGKASKFVTQVVPQFASQLLHRGYKLEKTRETRTGASLQAEPEIP